MNGRPNAAPRAEATRAARMRAWPPARLTFVALLGAVVAAGLGNGCSSRETPPVTTDVGTPHVIGSGACQEGATGPCHVAVDERDGVTLCFDGVATCTGGVWGKCGGPGATRPSTQPPASGSGAGIGLDASALPPAPAPPTHDPGDARPIPESTAAALLATRLERLLAPGAPPRRASQAREAAESPGAGAGPPPRRAVEFERLSDGRIRPAFVPGATTALARLRLPARASGFVELTDEASHVGVRFRLVGAADVAPAAARGVVAYPAALDGRPLLHRVSQSGTEDFVTFDAKPEVESLTYEVDVSRAAGLRLVASTLELLDANGAPRLRVAPPYVVDAHHARRAAQLTVDGCALDRDPRAPWGRPVTPPGASTCKVHVSWGAPSGAYPLVVDPTWTTTGAMSVPRETHSASMLGTGKVLIAGGRSGGIYHASAELYDPVTGTFAATSPMASVRALHFAAPFGSGTGIVLVAGGLDGFSALASAEIYDATTGLFTATGSLGTARYSARGTVLSASAHVLITGGFTSTAGTTTRTAEVYDPVAGAFTSTGSLSVARAAHSALELPDGTVLVSGGDNGTVLLASAETYDPATGVFRATAGAMTTARARHTATALPGGKVLLAGSWDQSVPAVFLASAELYDPVARTFAATGSLATARGYHVARALPSGQVVIAGGRAGAASTASSEIYDPAAGTFSALGTMRSARVFHTGTSLPTGTILLTGGANDVGGDEASAELLASPPGSPCANGADCTTALCSGGVCCAAACTEVCRTCQTGTGACVAVTNGVDPDSCPSPKICDGTGACAAPTSDAGTVVGDAAAGCVINPCDPYCAALPPSEAGVASTLDAGMSYFGSANGVGAAPAAAIASQQCNPCTGGFPKTCGAVTHHNSFDACESDSHCNTTTGACEQSGPSWTWPATACPGVDLTVQGSCKTSGGGDVFLVCNRGNAPLATGTVIPFHIVDATKWSSDPNACPTFTPSCTFTLPTPLVPGGCQAVDTCSWSGNAIVYANATHSIAECAPPLGPECADNWADIRAGASCQTLNVFGPTAVTSSYIATCPAGTWAHWSLFTYATTVASNASGTSGVKFEAQTAPVLPDGSLGAFGPWHTLADAPSVDVEDCTGSPCAVDLYAKLSAKPDAVQAGLSLRVTVTPTPDGTRSGTMDAFQLMYSCPPSE